MRLPASSRLWIFRRGFDVGVGVKSNASVDSNRSRSTHAVTMTMTAAAAAAGKSNAKAASSVSANLNPNSFVDERAPKTRAVYTLPSHPRSKSMRTSAQSLKKKFTFEFVRKSFSNISSRVPALRTEAAEPAPTPAQIRQQQHELAAAAAAGQNLRNI